MDDLLCYSNKRKFRLISQNLIRTIKGNTPKYKKSFYGLRKSASTFSKRRAIYLRTKNVINTRRMGTRTFDYVTNKPLHRLMDMPEASRLHIMKYWEKQTDMPPKKYHRVSNVLKKTNSQCIYSTVIFVSINKIQTL